VNFTSAAFFAFFTIFLLLYWKIAKDHRTMLLFLGSYVFYGFWDWRYLALLIILSIVNFTAGLVMHNSQIKKQVLLLALAFNMAILFTFKYFGFFVDNLKVLLASLGWQLSTTSLDLIIPLGISFYIFQVSSYSIDVYRN
jgi:D-alanyl-lipoteichoic acid acyltransferase DltB (MBOAT superfamily)